MRIVPLERSGVTLGESARADSSNAAGFTRGNVPPTRSPRANPDAAASLPLPVSLSQRFTSRTKPNQSLDLRMNPWAPDVTTFARSVSAVRLE